MADPAQFNNQDETKRVQASQAAGADAVDAANGFPSQDAPTDVHQGPVVKGEIADTTGMTPEEAAKANAAPAPRTRKPASKPVDETAAPAEDAPAPETAPEEEAPAEENVPADNTPAPAEEASEPEQPAPAAEEAPAQDLSAGESAEADKPAEAA